jgi:Tfp pilus assembly protein PilX
MISMSSGRRATKSERGMVLMSSLAILSVLVVVGIGAGLMLQNDYRTLSNLRGGTEAFYFSVAGLEWGKSEIARAITFPPVPQSQSKAFATGEFAVWFDSPAVIDPLAARIVLRATGTRGSAQHVLQAQLTKSYDLADAAAGLRGNGKGVDLSGDGVHISGVDHDVTTGDPIIGAKSKSAVSTGDEALRDLVMQAAGAGQGILESDVGTPTAAVSGLLDGALLNQLANDLCAAATLQTMPESGDLTIENQTWGTPDLPQLRCIDGLSASGDRVTVGGSFTGVGILVVRNADLVLSGTFRWEGLVLVTGDDVSFKSIGPSAKDLLGAVMVNETGNPAATRRILDIQGAVRMLFSRQALRRASSLIPAAALNSAYGSLPSAISQDYWRTVTP